jgi:hypothetical protein
VNLRYLRLAAEVRHALPELSLPGVVLVVRVTELVCCRIRDPRFGPDDLTESNGRVLRTGRTKQNGPQLRGDRDFRRDSVWLIDLVDG